LKQKSTQNISSAKDFVKSIRQKLSGYRSETGSRSDVKSNRSKGKKSGVSR
jgi:hypothetical protein